MIVRTYQRRSRSFGHSLSETEPIVSSQEWSSSQEHHHLSFSLPSSQDSYPIQNIQNIPNIQNPRTLNRIQAPNGKATGKKAMENASIKKKKPNGRRPTPGEMLKRAESSLTGMQSGETRKVSHAALALHEENINLPTRVWGPFAPPTSTLMEAQESGEMMENVDEANFAMEGLRPEQPIPIQRASLLSMLSICNSTQTRRFLRTHGIAKAVIDAVVCLPVDDPATALGAAGLLYMLACDGQDQHLFDSPICINFLIKLLKPYSLVPGANHESGLNNLPNSERGQSLHGTNAGCGGNDHEGAAVAAKVISLLESTKRGRFGDCKEDERNMILLRNELSSQLVALLTLEKACLSTVILEDDSGSVRKVGGHFKESLRELGGLNSVCNLAGGSYWIVKNESTRYSKQTTLGGKEPLSTSALNGVHLLQCCLKVMENVTFLSEANQRHLLEMIVTNEKNNVSDTFVGLIIRIIKTLSELVLLLKAGENVSCIEGDDRQAVSMERKTDKQQSNEVLERASTELVSAFARAAKLNYKKEKEMQLSFECKNVVSEVKYQRRKKLKHPALERNDGRKWQSDKDESHSSQVNQSIHQNQSFRTTSEDSCILIQEAAVGSTNQIQSSSMITSADFSDCQRPFHVMEKHYSSKKQVHIHNKKLLHLNEQKVLEDSQDPFDFDDPDLTLSECISKKRLKRFKRKMVSKAETVVVSRFNTVTNADQDLGKDTSKISQELEGSSDEKVKQQLLLLGDCLLSAVKVLMNLTNDNPVGCRQVASCGGLDSMVFILTDYLSVSKLKIPWSQDETIKGLDGRHAEQESELLVVVLGILVNLVEKDTENRSLLAALDADVSSQMTGFNSHSHTKGLIRLLCSIFLSNGSSEVSEDLTGKHVMKMDDETIIRKEQHEAESTIVEAYAALLLAFLSLQSDAARFAIASYLPGDDLKILVPVLERFLAFHLSLNMITSETHAVVIDVIESCKRPLHMQ